MVAGEKDRGSPADDIWSRRREWIRQLISSGDQFSLLPQHVRLLATDREFAQMFRIPPEVRSLARMNKAFFVAIPTEGGWVITVTDQPDFGEAKASSILRDELKHLALEIAHLVHTPGDEEVLIAKQQQAATIYQLLPRGMQQEFAYMAPWVVTNAGQRQTT